VLVLSTDRIAEATKPRGIPFGRDRLKDAIRALSEQPAEQIAQAIKQRVLDFSYPQALQDDLSVIVAKIL
jgi:serine phosphatase RsbU (regulator of sigma subunit)